MTRSLPARIGVACARRPTTTLVLVVVCLLLTIPGILRISVVGDLHRLIPQRSEASTGMALALEGLTRSDAVYGLVERSAGADPELLLEVGEQLATALAERRLSPN